MLPKLLTVKSELRSLKRRIEIIYSLNGWTRVNCCISYVFMWKLMTFKSLKQKIVYFSQAFYFLNFKVKVILSFNLLKYKHEFIINSKYLRWHFIILLLQM